MASTSEAETNGLTETEAPVSHQRLPVHDFDKPSMLAFTRPREWLLEPGVKDQGLSVVLSGCSQPSCSHQSCGLPRQRGKVRMAETIVASHQILLDPSNIQASARVVRYYSASGKNRSGYNLLGLPIIGSDVLTLWLLITLR